jgi:hypothetical protein
VLVAEPLVLDAVDDGEPLAAIDRLGGQFDEGLGVALEVVEAPAACQDATDGAWG